MSAARLLELAFVFVLLLVCLMVNLALGQVASMAAPVALAAAMLTGLSAYATSKRSLSERMHGFRTIAWR